MDDDRWIRLSTIENIFEMDMVRDALDRENIEYTIKEHRDTAYDGLFILQKGYASLYVRKRDEKQALSLVQRIKTFPYVAYPQD